MLQPPNGNAGTVEPEELPSPPEAAVDAPAFHFTFKHCIVIQYRQCPYLTGCEKTGPSAV